jgi:hypothetical protein
LESRAKSIVRSQWVLALLNILAGAAVATAAKYVNYEWVLAHLTAFGITSLIILLFIVGAVLFAVRTRFPRLYGATEIAVGILTALSAIFRINIQELNPVAILQVFGGIYIIVRGFDNFGRGIKGTAMATYWQKIFPS